MATYTREADVLRERFATLSVELAENDAQLKTVQARRVVLAEVLDEMDARISGPVATSPTVPGAELWKADSVGGEPPDGEGRASIIESSEPRDRSAVEPGGTRAGHASWATRSRDCRRPRVGRCVLGGDRKPRRRDAAA
ncbi:hypothetical protein B4N89_41130 [Embleya scabrispora]|uniref:Uncharacterized protein n=1 Tax=Embleya scabrispora TaxID=159449 RepID=A0A1T3NK35_9ACTN|nr:hypothetical protein B4N89_41130 [Embleya scabrispora]